MMIDQKVRIRLAKLLGMIGSNQDAEALTAARMAHEAVRKMGLTWLDVLAVPQQQKTPQVTDQPAQENPQDGEGTNDEENSNHADLATETLEMDPGVLSDWEKTFLQGVARYRTLSAKQQHVLNRLSRKVIEALEVSR